MGQKSISDNKTVDLITNYTIVFKSSKQQTKIVTFGSKDYTEIFKGLFLFNNWKIFMMWAFISSLKQS